MSFRSSSSCELQNSPLTPKPDKIQIARLGNPLPSTGRIYILLAHIIDLKNRIKKSQPENGPGLFRQNQTPAPATPAQLHHEANNYQSPTTRTISWSGQLHYHPNVPAIIITSVIFFGIAILIQIFQKNIITTIFFALIGVVILLNSRRKPEIGRFEINPAGVVIDDTRHVYPEIKSFWIEYDPELGIQELSLQLKKWYSPYIKIPIYGQNPVRLRYALMEFLPEVEHKDSMVEILSRKLGI